MTEILQSIAYVQRPATETPGAERSRLDSVRELRVCGSVQAAQRAWSLLESPQTLESLCRVIAREFQVEAGSCSADLRDLLEQLLRHDLIEISPDA